MEWLLAIAAVVAVAILRGVLWRVAIMIVEVLRGDRDIHIGRR